MNEWINQSINQSISQFSIISDVLRHTAHVRDRSYIFGLLYMVLLYINNGLRRRWWLRLLWRAFHLLMAKNQRLGTDRRLCRRRVACERLSPSEYTPDSAIRRAASIGASFIYKHRQLVTTLTGVTDIGSSHAGRWGYNEHVGLALMFGVWRVWTGLGHPSQTGKLEVDRRRIVTLQVSALHFT